MMEMEDQVRNFLIESNQNFQKGLDAKLKSKMSGEQRPFIAILACSDARADPNKVFNLQIGDAFVVRIAGNTCKSKSVLGSLEYAVSHLHVKNILILGHTHCGVAAATISEMPYEENIDNLLTDFRSARDNLSPDMMNNANALVEENVRLQIKLLKQRSTLISEGSESGKLSIIGAVLDLSNGQVKFL